MKRLGVQVITRKRKKEEKKKRVSRGKTAGEKRGGGVVSLCPSPRNHSIALSLSLALAHSERRLSIKNPENTAL